MTGPEVLSRLGLHIGTALANALGSMTGKAFTVTADRTNEAGDLAEPIVWRQSFSCVSGPALWIVAGKELWAASGELTLAAVGVDSVTDEDCRSTWQEIAGQTTGGFATQLTADLQQEVTATKGEEVDAEPSDVTWMSFTAKSDGQGLWHLKVGWAGTLLSVYDRQEADSKPLVGKDSTFSKTFDLLLDVALPVSVSFGKTSLQIREVLKLNTGSIVELNRFVAEPVEVVVNDCVIARGEVVVVDGNYGVRITQLASREDRLRFGMAESSSRLGAVAR